MTGISHTGIWNSNEQTSKLVEGVNSSPGRLLEGMTRGLNQNLLLSLYLIGVIGTLAPSDGFSLQTRQGNLVYLEIWSLH